MDVKNTHTPEQWEAHRKAHQKMLQKFAWRDAMFDFVVDHVYEHGNRHSVIPYEAMMEIVLEHADGYGDLKEKLLRKPKQHSADDVVKKLHDWEHIGRSSTRAFLRMHDAILRWYKSQDLCPVTAANCIVARQCTISAAKPTCPLK